MLKKAKKRQNMQNLEECQKTVPDANPGGELARIDDIAAKSGTFQNKVIMPAIITKTRKQKTLSVADFLNTKEAKMMWTKDKIKAFKALMDADPHLSMIMQMFKARIIDLK